MLPALSPSCVTPFLLFIFPLATKFSASLSHLYMPLTTSTVLLLLLGGGSSRSIQKDFGVRVYVCTNASAIFLQTLKVLQGPDTIILILISFIWREDEEKVRGRERGNAALGRRCRQLAVLWLCLDVCLKTSPKFGTERIFPLVLLLNILQKLPQDIKYCFDQINILCAVISS